MTDLSKYHLGVAVFTGVLQLLDKAIEQKSIDMIPVFEEIIGFYYEEYETCGFYLYCRLQRLRALK